ncbi:acyltransferase family protein [Massilia glaciei]|uniref:Acyltransferase n=1 Tax=Massilia glaciei TaxID=1524097 RepID=A0A2U2HMS2_9BURK|nr:acyltransferase [Massilia glaciei]PWF48715.1 acyltransferase [Massilia glaciei]
MNTHKVAKFTLLKHSALEQDSMHSLLISLLRGLAALQVAAAHLRAEIFPGFKTVADPSLWYQVLALATGFAHQAVVVFFLISGWLVGGSLLNKIGQPDALKLYAVDRVTRLWTVLIPTFGLIVLIGMVTNTVDPGRPDLGSAGAYSLLSFAGNLFGLQTIAVPNFGGNYVLWSLANESWYYLMFPLLLIGFTSKARGKRALAAAAFALAAAFVTFPILIYLAVWLLGTAFSRIKIDCSNTLRVLVFAVLAMLSLYYRVKGSNDDLVPASFVQDMILSIVFLMLLSSMQFKADSSSRLLARVKKGANFFSDFSFTLYVVHVPVIGLLTYYGLAWFGTRRLAPADPASALIYAGVLAGIVAFAYLFYLAFEAHTPRVRRLVKARLLQAKNKGAQGSSMPAGS